MSDHRPLILAIDDTPANLFTLGGALAAEFDLQIATSGERGLALAGECPPDLILLDVMMPDMDGYEVCQRLKAVPALMHVPVIFLTALSDPASEMKGLSLGAADYIAKPIGVEIARQRIRNVLEREHLRRALEAQLAERQQAQADLQQSEARFRHFFEKNSSVMLLIDPSCGAIKEANEAAVAYYGYPLARLLGMSITEINTLSPEAVVQEMQAARREVRGHFLFRHRLASGEVRDVEVYSTPIQTTASPLLFSIIHDITERRHAEEMLRKLSVAVEQSPASVVITDPEACIQYVNRRFSEVTGYDADEAIGQNPRLLQSGMTDHDIYLRLWNNLTSGQVWKGELLNKRKNGEFYWEESHVAPVRDASGAVTHYVAVKIDITQRKQAELALQQSDETLRSILDTTLDGYWRTDAQGRLLDVNPAYCRQSGYTREELLGMQIGDLDVNEDETFISERIRWLCENGREIFETVHRRKDGSMWPVEVSTTYRDSEGGEIYVFMRDITARKLAEAELEHHRSRLEELVDERTAALLATEARASHLLQSSADGLYGVDSAGRITFINAAGCQMLGYKPEEVIGRSAHEAFHHSRPDGSPFPIGECLGHHAVVRGEEVRIDNEVYWHSDGHAVPVMYAVHPMVLGDSNKGAVISFVDMSEQRAAAEARERALSAAENLARVRSEFLSNMSHEIRTPLNGVLGFAQIGLRNANDGAKSRNAFEKILFSGTRLLGVVNDILDFSKIDAGKIHLDPTPVSLVDVMEQARELLGERATAKGLDFRTDYAADLPSRCLIDELRLGQVLINLLSNAVKFTESGYVKLSAARQGDRLAFTVSDTGIGMSDDQLALLFNPFQQADGSTTRRFGGTGLGLAICKRIVELMGGDIRVASRPGQGSAFTFSVPFHPAPEASLPDGNGVPATTVASQRLLGLAILVAEDDEINQVIFEENLLEDGARVVIVGNGQQAIDRLRADGCQAYDVVLMDVQMPEMDGYEATRRILAMAPGLPVIGQTAHASPEERDKCMAAGMVAHIAKPIDPEALVELILKHAGARGGQ
ncbi:PAS domain S-box protein [Dechloromonas sp. XY25]|uniref:histidine kinase n=1 Tax=Dechloromonas hankyongensis TaxID=2908002 RepID=A0ABS9K1U5_9RHOO|nr:PAS domain S-box protein [Dechloromonas hankyongensis]MCG2577010.1 PAS domain S-box protein [Dechloromonas hankyongensis]